MFDDLPPMLAMRAVLWNLYETRRGERDGQPYGGADKVQLMVRRPQAEGTFRDELIDVTCEDAGVFRPLLKGVIEVPVGVMAPRDRPGQLVWFLQKGGMPREFQA